MLNGVKHFIGKTMKQSPNIGEMLPFVQHDSVIQRKHCVSLLFVVIPLLRPSVIPRSNAPHQLHKLVEQIRRVVRAGRRLRVVLHAEGAQVARS